MQRGQIGGGERAGKAHERRPDAAMDVRDFATEHPADEHVRASANGAREPEDLVTFAMAPPAAADRSARDGFGKARYWPARTLQHHSVSPDESEGSLRTHNREACL